MTASGTIMRILEKGMEPPKPARVVGKGSAPKPIVLPIQEETAPTRAAAKPIGPTDPLRHAVFLAKTLRRA